MNTIHHFVMYTLQEIALLSLVSVYLGRLVWLHRRFRAAGERQPRTRRPGTGPLRGAIYSVGVLGMPWHLESARNHPGLYIQFVLFHLGVAAAIVLSLVLPYAPESLASPLLRWTLGVAVSLGIIAALFRLHRRVTHPALRAMNTFDDYFSLSLLAVWLFLAFFSLDLFPSLKGATVDAFFVLTAFFLFYVPFSKISHYLYYPFARYFLGRSFGWRGVYPLVRVPVSGRGSVRRFR